MIKKRTYSGKKVLITGHTGFKGSWLAYWLHALGAEVYGISHHPRSEPNHYTLLNLYKSLKKDIHAELSHVEEISSLKPDIVFHLAAKAIVAKTFEYPEQTFQQTIMGAAHLLDLCRTCPSIKGIVMVTTDKVYEDMNWRWGYREGDALGGKDPYSVSKICVEHIVQCYRSCYGLNIAVARAGNVIGGGDWSYGRLIPDLVRATARGNPVAVHTPTATRPWQHVLDALHGYLLIGEKMLCPDGTNVNDTFNFGPDTEMTVEELLFLARAVWPEVRWEVDDTPIHPYMVYLLRLDCTKARSVLGWKPAWNIQESVVRTIRWYKKYYKEDRVYTSADIARFMPET